MMTMNCWTCCGTDAVVSKMIRLVWSVGEEGEASFQKRTSYDFLKAIMIRGAILATEVRSRHCGNNGFQLGDIPRYITVCPMARLCRWIMPINTAQLPREERLFPLLTLSCQGGGPTFLYCCWNTILLAEALKEMVTGMRDIYDDA